MTHQSRSPFKAIHFATAALLLCAPQALGLSEVPDNGVPETDGLVYAIAQAGDRVYVGGSFTTIGGVSRNSLAAFDAITGAIDAAWDPDPNNDVFAIAVDGGKVYAGGSFTAVNGGITNRSRIAAFDTADGLDLGTADAAWNPALSSSVNPGCLAVANGRVYAGGFFRFVNGGTVSREHLAAFEIANDSNTGAADAAWDPGLSPFGWVYSLNVEGGIVYVGGQFSSVNAGGVTRNSFAAFNEADGSSAATVDPDWDPNFNARPRAIAVSGGKVYAGGSFTTVNGGTTRNFLAAFNVAGGGDTGTADAAWDPDLNLDVTALRVVGGQVYAGGDFTTVNGGASRNFLAGFELANDSNTGAAGTWNPDADSQVLALEPSGAGLFAGGAFTTIGGDPKDNLAGFGSTVPVELSAFAIE